MSTGYRVKTLMLTSGERLPVLLDREGQPMFNPTIFALTEVRGQNLSSNTIGIVLRSVMTFHLFLDSRHIDVDTRFANGELLTLSEVEDLSRFCRLPLTALVLEPDASENTSEKVMSLEQARMRVQMPKHLPPQVDPNVAASRLRYIRMYLQWLINERLSRQGWEPAVAARFADVTRRVIDAINARVPNKSGRNTLKLREGLSEEDMAELLRVIDPRSPDNPWQDEHTRYRNALLINWLLYLGLRIGEALGVQTTDLDSHNGEVTIHRRADDINDPRRYQPQTKTRARVLEMNAALKAQTQAYILHHRRQLPQAKKHCFLFVASHTGRPMTLAAVGKLFHELRAKSPSLPKILSAHVLRHTWNDMFSKKMDDMGVTPEVEQHSRSYLMGWSPTSGTAADYTRRHVRNKAKQVSLELQNQLVNVDKYDGEE